MEVRRFLGRRRGGGAGQDQDVAHAAPMAGDDDGRDCGRRGMGGNTAGRWPDLAHRAGGGGTGGADRRGPDARWVLVALDDPRQAIDLWRLWRGK